MSRLETELNSNGIRRLEAKITELQSSDAKRAKDYDDLKRDVHVQFDAERKALYTHFDQLVKSLKAEIASGGEPADGEDNLSVTGDGGDNIAWLAADSPKVKVGKTCHYMLVQLLIRVTGNL